MRKLLPILLLFAISIYFCACEKGQESSDGYLSLSTPEPQLKETMVDSSNQGEAPGFSWETFLSDDGRVEYLINSDPNNTLTGLPIVDVSPHEFTAEEAHRVGKALFGDAQFFEFVNDQPISSEEQEENLARWETYLSDGTVGDLFKGNEFLISDYELVLSRFKANYVTAIENPSEIYELMPCEWIFHPDSFYFGEFAAKDPRAIRTVVDCEGVTYRFDVVNRISDDFCVHMIFAYLYNNLSPNNIDILVQQYELCKSTYPTAAQIESIQRKAQFVLDALDDGEWKIDVCHIERLPRGQEEAYIVTVKAVPVFQGNAAIRFAQLTNMRSSAEGAQHYYYSDASFTFAPDGTMLDFSIYSPVDITDVNNDAETLAPDELLNAAKTMLMQRGLDYYSRYYPADHAFAAKVYIDQMTYGLARIEVENGKTYRYVPALCLDGHVELINENGNLIFDSSTEGMTRMMVLNALDGTEIVYSSEGGITGEE